MLVFGGNIFQMGGLKNHPTRKPTGSPRSNSKVAADTGSQTPTPEGSEIQGSTHQFEGKVVEIWSFIHGFIIHPIRWLVGLPDFWTINSIFAIYVLMSIFQNLFEFVVGGLMVEMFFFIQQIQMEVCCFDIVKLPRMDGWFLIETDLLTSLVMLIKWLVEHMDGLLL